jgi:BirA family transcriptional regulator, biotin operon repressor / biotin---[acetyl-CoA-carboxylase] ligase
VSLGTPRLHLRSTDSTNERAKELAAQGATHGTLVTADMQTAGRGRQGRSWHAAPGEALLMSLVLRQTTELLPIAAAVAVAEAVGPEAMIKWPNDILVEGRKVAGILIERRQHQDWTVLGIGVNVAVKQLPPELAETAGSLGRASADVEPFLAETIASLGRHLTAPGPSLVAAWLERDALRDQPVASANEKGIAAGIDLSGHLLVKRADGSILALDAGEAHLDLSSE